jgi:hypothetical protein
MHMPTQPPPLPAAVPRRRRRSNPLGQVSQHFSCPLCAGDVLRTPHDVLDRLLRLFMPVRRYRCASAACRWEGALLCTQRVRQRDPAAQQR